MRLTCDSCGAEDEATKRHFLQQAMAKGFLVQRDRDGNLILPDNPAGPSAFRAPLLCDGCRTTLAELITAVRAQAGTEDDAEVQSTS